MGEQFIVEHIPDTWQTVTSPSTIFIDEEVACLQLCFHTSGIWLDSISMNIAPEVKPGC